MNLLTVPMSGSSMTMGVIQPWVWWGNITNSKDGRATTTKNCHWIPKVASRNSSSNMNLCMLWDSHMSRAEPIGIITSTSCGIISSRELRASSRPTTTELLPSMTMRALCITKLMHSAGTPTICPAWPKRMDLQPGSATTNLHPLISTPCEHTIAANAFMW